jgi:hypothetical protein
METRKMIHALYLGFLHRVPQESEIDFWQGKVDSGTSPVQLADAFLNCDEFKEIQRASIPSFAPPGHFYSPIVDTNEVRAFLGRDGNPSHLDAVNLSGDSQLGTWKTLLPHLKEAPFPEEKTSDYRYYFRNPSFSYADGRILYAMLRTHQPKKLIEVGSGYSSACSIDTIDRFLGGKVDVTFIEPYPQLLLSLLGNDRAARCTILSCGVQQTDLDLFKTLEDGDFLFIDSTHVLKTGSDVCHELFNILPILNPGVFVHFHDIFWPFEYPRAWVLDDNRSWNELYALRAFLMYNRSFNIEFFNDYFVKNFKDIVERDCPEILKNSGGSLWLRKLA